MAENVRMTLEKESQKKPYDLREVTDSSLVCLLTAEKRDVCSQILLFHQREQKSREREKNIS